MDGFYDVAVGAKNGRFRRDSSTQPVMDLVDYIDCAFSKSRRSARRTERTFAPDCLTKHAKPFCFTKKPSMPTIVMQVVTEMKTVFLPQSWSWRMLKRGEILSAIEAGMEEASSRWFDIFGEQPDEDLLSEKGRKRRNEQFYSSFVADSLRQAIAVKREGDYVTHETHHFVLEQAIRQLKGNVSKINLKNVYDLVLWNNYNKPYAVIEIKIPFRWFNLKNDAEKLCKLLLEAGTCCNGTIKSAYITFPLYDRKIISAQQSFLDSLDGLGVHLEKTGLLKDGKKLGSNKWRNHGNRSSGAFRISSQMVR